MKRNYFFLVLIVLILAACDTADSSTKNTDDTLTGTWKLIKYKNTSSNKIESEPTDIYRSIVLDFQDNGLEGTMKGHTVTNTVSGTYEITGGKKMKTMSFGGSKVGEPNWGSKFWTSIYAASSYERNGDQLFILFNDNTEQMEFKAQ
jgi:META domain